MWVWALQVHFHVDFFSVINVAVSHSLWLVESVDVEELGIWMADCKLYADFWLVQRVSSPHPCVLQELTVQDKADYYFDCVLNRYIKSLLAGIFWHVSELKSTCNVQITHFCSATRLIFNMSSSPHPHLDWKRSWYHIDQTVKRNTLWKNPNFLANPVYRQ